jgi:ParB family transcriptional regulator, chromosome partitioning protein
MAKITDVREIPLKDLAIGKGPVRTRNMKKDVTELADSIRKIGLLEPIVVCPAEKPGKYEIITGQRRFLAHQDLKKQTILAAILDEIVDVTTAKVLSISAKLVRRDLNRQDLIDACTALFRKYGSIRAVVDETGLPYSKVSDYVKYDQLSPKLREMVDKGEVELKAALRVQKAATATGDMKVTETVKLAKEMSQMSGVQQSKLVKQIEKEPTTSVDELIEAAKTGEKLTQIVVTLGPSAHQGLSSYAKDEGTTQDDAARILIEEGLSLKGFLEE